METSAVQKAVKYLGWLCIVLIIFVGISAWNALKENKYIGGMNQNVITVSGDGEVFAVPDIAEFTYGVFAEAKTVAEAQAAAAEKGNAIIAFLKGEGIAEKDIKTTQYSANPKYEWTEAGTGYYPRPQNQKIVGYEVRQTVSVKVRDTEAVGALLSGVGELGATDIYGPTFTIDDEDELQREARQKAIEDAQEKAKQLADDLDVRLVRVVSFSENGGAWPMYYAKGEFDMAVAQEAGAPSPEIPLGENKITASVSITYEIR